jgi:uncharacterized surface protein with fasciclin (FAS1) repeats
MFRNLLAAAAVSLAVGFTPALKADTLADILLADGDMFDSNQNDFDIVTEAVIATGLDGAAASLTLTAFLPTDKAFRILVEDLYGISIKNEEALFNAIVEALTPDGVKEVLLYHLVSGVVTAADVVELPNGTPVNTLLDESFDINFRGKGQIRLVDGAPFQRDPIIRQTDIFADNGVAHVIDRVLLPPADETD